MLLTFPYTVFKLLDIFAYDRFYYNITPAAKIPDFKRLRTFYKDFSQAQGVLIGNELHSPCDVYKRTRHFKMLSGQIHGRLTQMSKQIPICTLTHLRIFD